MNAKQLAIGGVLTMDNETKEILQLILNGQEELKQNVNELKQDVSVLKQDVSVLKQDVSGLKQNMQNINLKLENVVEPKIQLIYENQIDTIEHNQKAKTQENRIENLENDVFALKYAFKSLKQG